MKILSTFNGSIQDKNMNMLSGLLPIDVKTLYICAQVKCTGATPKSKPVEDMYIVQPDRQNTKEYTTKHACIFLKMTWAENLNGGKPDKPNMNMDVCMLHVFCCVPTFGLWLMPYITILQYQEWVGIFLAWWCSWGFVNALVDTENVYKQYSSLSTRFCLSWTVVFEQFQVARYNIKSIPEKRKRVIKKS